MRRHPQSKGIVSPSKKLSPHERLELYAQQYWWRIQSAFDEDFETVQKVLTPKCYAALRDDYLGRFPSVSFTLRNLGSRFPAFVRSTNKLAPRVRALVADCASFDWARVEAFDGARRVPITGRDITAPSFAGKHLQLQPHVQLLALEHPVDILVRSGGAKTQEEASNTLRPQRLRQAAGRTAKIRPERVFLAVHRHREGIFMKRLSRAEFQILLPLQTGSCLRKVLRNTPKAMATGDVVALFTSISALGWLSVAKPQKAPVRRKGIHK